MAKSWPPRGMIQKPTVPISTPINQSQEGINQFWLEKKTSILSFGLDLFILFQTFEFWKHRQVFLEFYSFLIFSFLSLEDNLIHVFWLAFFLKIDEFFFLRGI